MARFAGRVAAATAAVALLPASCSSAGNGPLGNGVTSGRICIPVRAGGVVSYGVTELQNTGGRSAVITNVVLVGAKHLRMPAVYVVPIGTHLGYGVWPGWPPAPHQAGVQWSRHTRAVGTRLPPAQGMRHIASLVQVLQPTGPVGVAQATEVDYTVGGNHYSMVTKYQFVLVRGGVNACSGTGWRKYLA